MNSLEACAAIASGEPVYSLAEVSAIYDRARKRGFEEADDAWGERFEGLAREVDDLQRALATFAVEAAKNTRRALAEIDRLEGCLSVARVEREVLLAEAREEADAHDRLKVAILAHRAAVSANEAADVNEVVEANVEADRRLWAEVGP